MDHLISLKVFEYALRKIFPLAHVLNSGVTQEGFFCNAALPYFSEEQTLPLIEEAVKGIVKEALPIKTFEMMKGNGIAYLIHHHQVAAADQAHDWPGNTLRMGEFDGFPFPLYDAEIGGGTNEGGSQKILYVEQKGEQALFRVAVKENPQALKQWVKLWNSVPDPTHLAQEMQLIWSTEDKLVWLPKGVFLRDKIKNLIDNVLEGSLYRAIDNPASIDFKTLLKKGMPLQAVRQWREQQSSIFSRDGLYDAPLFTRCTLEALIPEQQVEQEVISSLLFFDKIFKIFGFEGEWTLAVDRAAQVKAPRTEWDRAVKWLTGALEARGASPSRSERHSQVGNTASEGARNPQTWLTADEGPVLQGTVADKLGRKWLIASLGIDLSAAEGLRENLSSKGEEAPQKPQGVCPILVKGAVVESLERIIALLLANHEGVIPWEWNPEQLRVVSVGQQVAPYASEVRAQLVQAGFRTSLDNSGDKLGAKIHAAELERIPYVVVVGDRELKNGQMMVRSYKPPKDMTRKEVSQKDFAPEGTAFKIDEFLRFLGNANGKKQV